MTWTVVLVAIAVLVMLLLLIAMPRVCLQHWSRSRPTLRLSNLMIGVMIWTKGRCSFSVFTSFEFLQISLPFLVSSPCTDVVGGGFKP